MYKAVKPLPKPHDNDDSVYVYKYPEPTEFDKICHVIHNTGLIRFEGIIIHVPYVYLSSFYLLGNIGNHLSYSMT